MEVLRTAILDKLRRMKGESFTTSQLVKQIYPEDWEQFLEDVNSVAMDLSRERLIKIEKTESESTGRSSLRISSPNKLQ